MQPGTPVRLNTLIVVLCGAWNAPLSPRAATLCGTLDGSGLSRLGSLGPVGRLGRRDPGTGGLQIQEEQGSAIQADGLGLPPVVSQHQ
mmetsp:Transcript_15145/g.33441  ORF Transcript_15145/g.33441 Transcript_15145/m.33441 type:complete len:88 (+) Transcript_15145:39-302(+)